MSLEYISLPVEQGEAEETLRKMREVIVAVCAIPPSFMYKESYDEKTVADGRRDRMGLRVP